MPTMNGKYFPTSWDILLTPAEQEARRKAEADRSKLEQWMSKQALKAKQIANAIWEGRE